MFSQLRVSQLVNLLEKPHKGEKTMSFSTDRLVAMGAQYLLSGLQISEEKRNQIMPATKYNVLVKAFNVASVLLVVAAVSAVFLAMTSAFVLMAVGLFLRFTAEKKLDEYTKPLPLGVLDLVVDALQTSLLRHADRQTPESEKVANIFRHVGLPRVREWEPNQVELFDCIIVKNEIPISEVIEPREAPRENAEAVGENPPAPGRAQLSDEAFRRLLASAAAVQPEEAGGGWFGNFGRQLAAAFRAN